MIWDFFIMICIFFPIFYDKSKIVCFNTAILQDKQIFGRKIKGDTKKMCYFEDCEDRYWSPEDNTPDCPCDCDNSTDTGNTNPGGTGTTNPGGGHICICNCDDCADGTCGTTRYYKPGESFCLYNASHSDYYAWSTEPSIIFVGTDGKAVAIREGSAYICIRSRSNPAFRHCIRVVATNTPPTGGNTQPGGNGSAVTGIEISSYGHDLKDGTTLIDLLELIAREGGEMRIRLGSLEPRTVTREFCERAKKLPTLCPHFHLSMQSGCDATLKRMNRRYDTARYYESVELLREYFDDPAITTDLITGFPEETEEEFGETLAFIEKCGFAAMHLFPYSIRPGTKAAAMAQVDMSVREERAARAAAVAERMHQGYLARCVGKTFPVLFEQDRGEGSVGHAPNYMPVTVGMKGLHNTVQNVRITAVDGDGLRGEPEET